jgi:hypothetical protein
MVRESELRPAAKVGVKREGELRPAAKVRVKGDGGSFVRPQKLGL